MRKLIVITLALTGTVAAMAQQSSSHAPADKAQVDRWMTELSNWGRWGKDDQLGALNFVTSAKKKEAMALAKEGVVVSLEQPIKIVPEPAESKADGKPHGISFYEIRFNTFPADDPQGNPGFTSDLQTYHVHGGMTHLDALCHDSSEGRLYNGYGLKDTVNDTRGCTRLGLDNLPEGIVTRGVLVDMSKLRNRRVPAGQPANRVYVEDLEAWETQTGVRVEPGDALFVYNNGRNGGFDISVAPWMKARGVAVTSGVRAVADDNHADHRLVLVALGTYLLDGVDLGGLAATAARLNRYTFMLVVAPLRAPGSSGSLVNPLAMF